MGLLDRIGSAWGALFGHTKSAPEGTPRLREMVHSGWGGQGGYWGGPHGWGGLLLGNGGRGLDHADRAGDMSTNAAVAACLGVWEDNFSQPKIQVRDRAKATGEARDAETVDVDHELVKLYNRPNPSCSRYDFWSAMIKSAIVDGNAYALKVRSRARIPVQLWWVPPWMLTPRWDLDGSEWIGWWEYRVDGRTYAVDPADVIHWKYGTPDPRNNRVVVSKLKQAAARSVSSLNEVDAFTAFTLINGGVPSIAIRPKEGIPPPDRDEAARMTEDWKALTQGSRKGEPFIAGGYFDVVPIGFSPEQLALDKIPARLEDQVCALTGVPAMMVGLTSGAVHKTHANYGEARKAFYEDRLIPMQDRLAECLAQQLLGDPGMGDPETEEVVFSYEGIACLQEDQDKLWARVGTGYEKGLITRAAAKGKLGLDFDEDDEVYVDVGTIPADPDEAARLAAEAQAAAQAIAGEAKPDDEDDDAEAPAARVKSHAPCRDAEGQFASCGVGGSAGKERRQASARRRRSQGPDSGVGPSSRAYARRRKGRHRESQRRFEKLVAGGQAHPDSVDLHASHSAARRELAQDLKAERRESRQSIRPDRKQLGKEIRQERKDTRAGQAKDRKEMARDQKREAAKLERTHERERAKLEGKLEAQRAASKNPEGLAGRHAERREELATEHREAAEYQATEHREARRQLLSDQREARQDDHERHRDQVEEHRKGERDTRNEMYRDHRERIYELRTEQRRERADLHRDARDRPARAGKGLEWDESPEDTALREDVRELVGQLKRLVPA